MALKYIPVNVLWCQQSVQQQYIGDFVSLDNAQWHRLRNHLYWPEITFWLQSLYQHMQPFYPVNLLCQAVIRCVNNKEVLPSPVMLKTMSKIRYEGEKYVAILCVDLILLVKNQIWNVIDRMIEAFTRTGTLLLLVHSLFKISIINVKVIPRWIDSDVYSNILDAH